MILPSGAPTTLHPAHPSQRWSPDHLRLHRHLLRHPGLLPAGAPLLLAVSGGQDSMALLALLLDLRRLHHWTLLLWHGDHGWRAESARQAEELAAWCLQQGLNLVVDRCGEGGGPSEGGPPSEAMARHWRYGQLEARARTLGASHVVTGHTASDRAETLLLHLARGSHRRGLASLRSQRPLAKGPDESRDSSSIELSRPLLTFSRSDTARICRQLELPVWHDPANHDLRYSRNRIRAEVLPVLEALHPGAAQRIGAQAERLVSELECRTEMVDLALQNLNSPSGPGAAAALERLGLVALAPANQGELLHRWLECQIQQVLAARPLELLLSRLQAGQPPGRADLGAGWQLHWDQRTLWLQPDSPQ